MSAGRHALVAALALTALGAGCVDPDPSISAEDLDDVDLTPAHTITVDEDGFDPATLEIDSGDVVRLVNAGTGEHSFTAAERFDTGRMRPGEDVILVLEEPGEIPYRDLESDAVGTLTVRPAR